MLILLVVSIFRFLIFSLISFIDKTRVIIPNMKVGKKVAKYPIEYCNELNELFGAFVKRLKLIMVSTANIIVKIRLTSHTLFQADLKN